MAIVDSSSRISSSLEFFKVFFPNSSSERMSIPPAFVKYFNGRIPSEAVIRDQSGKSWHVTLEELKNVVFFKDGWQEFVDSHLLKLGEFLVFQYDGSHMFDVKIFSKNGCKKKLVSRTGTPFPVAKVKDEPQSEHDYSTSLTRCKRSDSEVRSTGSGTAPKSKRRSTSNLEELSPSNNTEHISTKSPTFEHIVRHWSRNSIHIPKPAIVTHNILLKPNVVIVDEMGRSWVVTAKPISRGRFALTTGWPAFFRENSLIPGDECTFEFVLGSNNICGELKVKIMRTLEITQQEKQTTMVQEE
ncbi:putative B3 domain-containing protein At5g66980 [Benincasa hispida]|uniref:putative B3 domain-containing protein At5g66980 n=1 Tax=Benincasa hispida TaxID=102211 RepID=UPI0019013C0E|nr:putative B3 domain-containing protein At5g66980 [Benincasa hispida]XP_038881004.1 putative B3 domain-containing protein At5g66980 [Benincasa hispida]XP_038881006.1 putative B3 domain-containing protein At5g66980 [Benincasa hispida]